MFKTTLLVSLAAAGVLLSGLASAENYLYENNEWEQPGHRAHPGGHFSIHIVPPPPPPHHYRPQRCLSGGRVDQLQAEQASRIQAGRQDGDLTRSEEQMLWDQQDRIADLERRMRRDGCLAPNERDDLINRLDQAGRTIWRERNDNERRGHYRPSHGGWNNNRH